MGPTDSQPIECKWTPPSRVPGFGPWLVILVLLAFRINHTFDAWYAVVPVLLLVGVQSARNYLSSLVSTSELDMLITTGKLMGFGLCAAWLLLPLLKAKNRFFTFLKTVPVFWVATSMTAWSETAWNDSSDSSEAVGLVITAGVLGVIFPMVLLLAGRMCRKRYGRWRFVGWMTVFSVAVAALGILPFAISAWIQRSGPTGIQLMSIIGIFSGVIFVSLLLFVVLSWLNRFHGERFLSWLGLREEVPIADSSSPGQEGVLCSVEGNKS